MSNKINKETIDHLAHLARLEFDEEGKQAIAKDLNNMLGFVEKLNELNTDGVEPLIYLTDETNDLREDIIIQDLTQKEALQNAPKHDSDYFKVPKVLDKNAG